MTNEKQTAEQWMAENYPNGTEIGIDDNICECESYTIGEQRCECGNRRISAYPEKSGDSFYLMVEPF